MPQILENCDIKSNYFDDMYIDTGNISLDRIKSVEKNANVKRFLENDNFRIRQIGKIKYYETK